MKVIVDNIVIEYQIEGEGSPVLLMHGWGRDMHDFDSLGKALAPEYKVVKLDLPGFGKSEMIKGVSVGDYANFIKNFLEKIQLKPDYYIGHSFGGRILLKGFGSEILPKPKKIVLIASAGVRVFKIKNAVLGIVSKIGKTILSIPPFSLLANLATSTWKKLLNIDFHTSGQMKEVFKAAVSEDLRGYAASIQTPTLLIWGKDDVVTPLEEGEILHSLIRDSQIEVFDNAGHFVFKEQESKVNHLIKNYFK